MRQDFFDPGALARSVGHSLASRAAAKGLQSPVEISEKLPAFVMGDPVRLRAALENLIDNAVKFTEQRQVALRVTPLRPPRGKVSCAFAVSDTGIGLTLDRNQSPVPSVLAGQRLDRDAVWWRRTWVVVGKQLARAMGGDIAVKKGAAAAHFTLTRRVVAAPGRREPQSGADASAQSRRARSRA